LREFHCGPSWQMSLTVPGGCALVTYYAPHSRTCPSRLPAPAVAPPASPVSHARRRSVLCHSPPYPRTTSFADARGCLQPRALGPAMLACSLAGGPHPALQSWVRLPQDSLRATAGALRLHKGWLGALTADPSRVLLPLPLSFLHSLYRCLRDRTLLLKLKCRCGQLLKAPEQSAGQVVRCPRCQTRLRVAGAAAP